MNESVSLFMMPVCVCGHIFRDLKLIKEESIPLDPSFAIGFTLPKSHFEPCYCPDCGRRIETVLVKDLKPDDFGEIIFIENKNRPEIV